MEKKNQRGVEGMKIKRRNNSGCKKVMITMKDLLVLRTEVVEMCWIRIVIITHIIMVTQVITLKEY